MISLHIFCPTSMDEMKILHTNQRSTMYRPRFAPEFSFTFLLRSIMIALASISCSDSVLGSRDGRDSAPEHLKNLRVRKDVARDQDYSRTSSQSSNSTTSQVVMRTLAQRTKKDYHSHNNYKYPLVTSVDLLPLERIRSTSKEKMRSQADKLLQGAADQFDVLSVRTHEHSEVHGRTLYLLIKTAEEYASAQEYFENLSKDTASIAGAVMKVDEQETQILQRIPKAYHSSTTKQAGEPSFSVISPILNCYRDVQGSYDTLDWLKSAYPDLVKVTSLGPSYRKMEAHRVGREEGYDLRVLRLTDSSSEKSKAPMFIVCSIHPRELAPAEACARFAESLLKSYADGDADAQWILERTEIHLLVQANPDGRHDEEIHLKAEDYGHLRRKNMRTQNAKDRSWCGSSRDGVDLNRNFPHEAWGQVGASKTNPCSPVYAGHSAGSEPETAALVSYLSSIIKKQKASSDSGVLIDVHSYGQDFFWPHGYTGSSANPDLGVMARKMASFTVPSPYNTANAAGYLTSGDTTDWAYDVLGTASFTIELGTTFYEDCRTFEEEVLPSARGSLLYAARVAHAPYDLPKGPEVMDLQIVESEPKSESTVMIDLPSVRVIVSDSLRADGHSTGSHHIATVLFCVDRHPYDNDDIEQNEEDSSCFVTQGTRSSTTETLEVKIPLLLPIRQAQRLSSASNINNRHILYVQAEDTNFQKGPVYAKYFNVVLRKESDEPTLAPTPFPTQQETQLPSSASRPYFVTLFLGGAVSPLSFLIDLFTNWIIQSLRAMMSFAFK